MPPVQAAADCAMLMNECPSAQRMPAAGTTPSLEGAAAGLQPDDRPALPVSPKSIARSDPAAHSAPPQPQTTADLTRPQDLPSSSMHDASSTLRNAAYPSSMHIAAAAAEGQASRPSSANLGTFTNSAADQQSNDQHSNDLIPAACDLPRSDGDHIVAMDVDASLDHLDTAQMGNDAGQSCQAADMTCSDVVTTGQQRCEGQSGHAEGATSSQAGPCQSGPEQKDGVEAEARLQQSSKAVHDELIVAPASEPGTRQSSPGGSIVLEEGAHQEEVSLVIDARTTGETVLLSLIVESCWSLDSIISINGAKTQMSKCAENISRSLQGKGPGPLSCAQDGVAVWAC